LVPPGRKVSDREQPIPDDTHRQRRQAEAGDGEPANSFAVQHAGGPFSFAESIDLPIEFRDGVKRFPKQIFPNDMLRPAGTVQIDYAGRDELLIDRKVNRCQAFRILG
jgi:hypothetical protein